MKDTKRIQRKTNKSVKASLYENLYPINLYVAYMDDWDDISNFFDFYIDTEDLRNDRFTVANKPIDASGATYLVREKNTKAIGVLIILADCECSTLAHESIHYADAIYEYLRINAEGYNAGNEAYAYLVTWCVECLEDFIECTKKVRKTTGKTTKRGGN